MEAVLTDLSQEAYYSVGTDVTSASFPTIAPTTVKPTGSGVISFGNSGSICPKWLELIPYGTGVATNTFTMQVIGWTSARSQGSILADLWVPVPLATYAVTLGTGAGVAGSALGSTYLFATTITSTGGPTFITSGAAPIVEGWFQISPGSNGIAFISQASLGHRFLQVIFETGSSTTACNAIYRRR